jgi:dTDP-4-amino-4,6-dideoxygalactose transaminase
VNVPFVDLRAQYEEVREELEPLVLEVLASGRYTPGEHVRRLEEEIAGYCGVEHGIACNSGTDALRMALQAIGVGKDDEVITTPFTFVATVEAILQNGAKPVFVDIDPRTFNINVEQVEQALSPRTKAIIPVHLFGQLADMESLQSLAERYGIAIVEDAAQALGSTRKNKPAGSWGVATALSFFPTKNLGAAGDAGMILTNDSHVASTCRKLRIHGMGEDPYVYEHIGYTSRMDEIQAVILRVKFGKLERWTHARQAHAEVYHRAFQDTEIQIPFVHPETTCHTYHQYTVRTPHRDELRKYLTEHGVATQIYYPVPLHLQPAYRFLGYHEGDFPEAERASREVLSLPIHPHLSAEQVEYVADVVLHFATARAEV